MLQIPMGEKSDGVSFTNEMSLIVGCILGNGLVSRSVGYLGQEKICTVPATYVSTLSFGGICENDLSEQRLTNET